MIYYDEDFILEVEEAVNKGLIVPYATERLLHIIRQQQTEIERFKADKIVYATEYEQLERNFQSAKAEIKALIAGQETLQKYIEEKNAEIARLQSLVKDGDAE
jgi:predicted  nucleic acid-binding Zn-ribbon protein